MVTAGGAAVCTTSSLTTYSDTITASYSGDLNFTVATTASITEYVGKSAARTTLSSSPVSPTVNQTVVLTAAVVQQYGGIPPTGYVTFAQGATTLCSTGITNNQTATCSYAFSSAIPSPGATITATYSGDSNFSSGTPATIAEIVTAANTTTTVVSTPNPSAVNQQVAFTATVTPVYTAGTGKPTGTVQFSNASTNPATPLCTVTIANGFVPVCNASFSSQGAYNIVATYTSGDGNFLGSTSGAYTQNVGAGPTSVTLTSSLNPSSVNQLVAFNATIGFNTSGTAQPTGTVSYYDGAATLANCTFTATSAAPFTNGIVPACSVALSTAVPHPISAKYSGDSNFNAATSTVLSQGVNATSTTTTVSSLPNPSVVNTSVTFTATVTPAFTAGSAAPAGKVVFTNTSTAPTTTLCTEPLSGGVVQTCNYIFASAGTYNVIATYTSTDLNFTGSATSAAYVQTVGAGSTSVSLNSSLATGSAVNQAVTFTASIVFTSSGTQQPTGVVTYADGATTLCTFGTSSTPATFTGGTVPACTVALFTAGTHSITATYSGDSNFGKSSGTLSQPVTPAATGTTVAATPASPQPVNTPVTFTATVTPNPAPVSGSVSPTGNVTFNYSVLPLGAPAGTTPTTGVLCSPTVAVSGAAGKATASCLATLTATGTYSITAIYGSDANFNGSTSSTYSFTIGTTATALTLSSSPSTPIITATEGISFTAVVTPVGTPGTSPTGTVAFTSSDGTLNQVCAAIQVTPVGNGSATATCSIIFPPTSTGSITIAAAYSGDPNFQPSSSSSANPFTVVVKNFGIAFSAPASGASVYLTQGFTNASDPFNPAPVTVTLATSGGFSDGVKFICTVTNTSLGALVTDPSCSVSPALLASATNGTVLTYTVSASAAAPIGSYTVALTALDTTVTSLAHTTTTSVPVYVMGVATALSLAPGATGTASSVVFNTATAPSTAMLESFACGNIVQFVKGVPVETTLTSSTGLITCVGPSAGQAVTGIQTPVQISITPVATSTATLLHRSSTIYAATLLGIPFLALAGWIGSRRSSHKNFFRFIALILMVVGISYAAGGCGGSFTQPAAPPTSTLEGNSYYVQVVATDQNGNQYDAVVPLTVNQ